MKLRARHQTDPLVWVLALLWVGLLLSIGSGALAGEDAEQAYQPSLFATIQRKTPDLIITSKQRFAVTTQTSIRTMRGKKMTLRQLPVPCKAEIQYSPQAYGDRIVTAIVVRKVFPGATADWAAPAPE